MLGQRLIADMPNKGESMGKSSRRQFLGAVLCALGAENLPAAAKPERVDPKPSYDKAKTPGAHGDLKVRFLGTGVGPMGAKGNECGDWRRHTSILLDERVLVDFTKINFETLPKDCRPEVVFYTHSHPDHCNAEAALALGVKRVYCHESWVDVARARLAKAANGRKTPEVLDLKFGAGVVECGMTFTALPANHSTGLANELCAIYLVEKGPTRLLYAVDTSGLPRQALKFSVNNRRPANPLTAIIMEATAGIGKQDDAGLFFSHSSVDTVERTVRALSQTGRYRPPSGRPVYITHLWRPHYLPQAQTDAALPNPLRAAYDGLELLL